VGKNWAKTKAPSGGGWLARKRSFILLPLTYVWENEYTWGKLFKIGVF